MEKWDEAVIKQYENDLKYMDAEEIDKEIKEVQERVDNDEAWLEALHAFKRKISE